MSERNRLPRTLFYPHSCALLSTALFFSFTNRFPPEVTAALLCMGVASVKRIEVVVIVLRFNGHLRKHTEEGQKCSRPPQQRYEVSGTDAEMDRTIIAFLKDRK